MKIRKVISSTRPGLLAGAILGLTASHSHAANITWDAARNITGDSNVSTAGTLVGAFNFNGVATTVNTVTFQPFAALGPGPGLFTAGSFTLQSLSFGPSSNTSSAIPQFTALSLAYQALLGTGVIGLAVPSNLYGTLKLTMGGLTVGQQYQFETWANDPASSSAGTVVADNVQFANPVPLDTGDSSPTNQHLGQYVVGTFTANAASQDVYFNTDIFAAESVTNGFQLRSVSSVSSVPDTGSTFALLGFALLGLTALHRKTAGMQKA